MATPEVSVCITTFNQRRYIKECLTSALACAGTTRVEIIVGDDASDDGTSEIVASFVRRAPGVVRHVRHEVRLGAFRNYDHVIALARAPLIAHLDGDDYWLPGKLELQKAYMDARPGCAAVYTNAITVDECGRGIGVFNNIVAGEWGLDGILAGGNFLNTSSMVFRTALRESLLEIGAPYLDYLMHLRFARSGMLVQLPGMYAAYRIDAKGSMVASMGERVRELYWASILDVPDSAVSAGTRDRGMADFLRRVMMRETRNRNGDAIAAWFERVAAEVTCSRAILVAHVASSLARVSGKSLARQAAAWGRAPPAMVVR